MKQAYSGELSGSLQALDSIKADVEAWYALRLEDSQVDGSDSQKKKYEELVKDCDAAIAKSSSSMKLVKSAIVSSRYWTYAPKHVRTYNVRRYWIKTVNLVKHIYIYNIHWCNWHHPMGSSYSHKK